MDKDYFVFIYKRETINKFDLIKNSHSKWINYILTPLEIVEGKIKEENGTKIFYTEDGKYNLKSIENLDGLNDEFVYAFPYDVTEFNADDKNETRKYFAEDILYNVRLLQSHEIVNKKEVLKTYANNVYNDKVFAIINPDSYDESEAVVEYDANEYIKNKVPDGDTVVLKYADTLRISKEKEYKEEKEASYPYTPHKAVKYNKHLIYADELYDEVKKYVLCQDEQIKTIATIFAKNQRITDPHLKSNFILCGPTGVGKTEIFRRISQIAQVPMITEDSSEFTAEGYVGRSITSILTHLYNAANGDLKAAENGIVQMDEIDKKAGGRSAGDLEVGKAAVIDALLKMIEGHTYQLTVDKKLIYFDTSRLTFAFSGAFSGIEKFAKVDTRKIGFGSKDVNTNVENLPPEAIYNYDTLIQYQMAPEFLGRNFIIPMNRLLQENLEEILKNGELSALKLYKKYLSKEIGIKLVYDDKVIKAIAAKAIEKKTGARSLNAITEETLQGVNYFAGSRDANKYSKVIITEETVEDPKKFILR